MNSISGFIKECSLMAAVLALVLACGGIPPAHADEKSEEEGKERAKTDSSYVLAPVKVFANKREQSAQDTPISMTIMDGEDLEDAGIKTLKDVFNRIPNLYSGSTVGNNQFMSFRGKTTMGLVEANPLIVYVDGVPMDSFLNTDPGLLNIERIEVLRGSQSVMYGKSSMGGVINIISRKPNNEKIYKAYASAGSHWTRELGVLASGPIVEDRVFYSVSGQYDGTEGYMENVNSDKSNSSNTGRLKGQLRLTPTSRLNMNLIGEYLAERKGMEPMVKGSATLESDLNPDDKTTSNALSGAFSLGYAADWAKFESVTTYRRDSVDYQQDLTYLGIGLSDSGRDVEKQEFSQEFRLKSPEGEKGISWLAGLYGSHKDHDRKKIYSHFPALATWSHFPNEETADDYAVFGQMVFPFLGDKLELSPALRYQYTSKDIDFKHYTEVGGVVMPGNQVSTSDSWSAVLPRLTLSYHFTDEVMGYTSMARGYQPGGFNWSSTLTKPEDHTFDEQKSWDYEVGVKSQLLEKKVTLNATLFYSDISDLQTTTYDAATMSYRTDNAGQSYSWGGELDFMTRLAKGLDLELSAAFTRAKYKEYAGKTNAGGFDYAGNHVSLTPAHTLSAALQYKHENGLFARGEILNYGKLYWDDANTSSRDGMTITNAKLGYESESWRAYLYGNNVFDKRYLSYHTAVSGMSSVGAPREYGIRGEVTF